MSRQTAAQASAIRTAATRAGITWPPDLDAALDAADLTLDPPDQAAVATLTYEALKAGRDPATDPDVLAVLARYGLATAVPHGMLQDLADAARTDAIRDHADGIIDQLQDAVTDADKIIEESRQAVPNLDIDNADQAGSLRPEQAKAWAQARDAAAIVGAAVQCWRMITEATGACRGGGRHGNVLLAADLDLDQLDQLTGVKPTYRDVIAAGWPLDLAGSPNALRDRVDKIADQRERHDARSEAAFRDAYRQQSGIAVRVR